MRRHLNKLLLFLFFLALTALAGYVVAGPYLTINGIQRALSEQNTEALEKYVDFPRLRGNLKHQLDNYYLSQQAGIDQSGLPALIGRLTVIHANSIAVDAILSPAGIALLLQGRSVLRAAVAQWTGQPAGGHAPVRNDTDPIHLLDKAEHRFESVSRFTATVHHADESATTFVFERQGLRWKLVDIRLPFF